MGTTFSTTGRKDQKVYMRCPDLGALDSHTQVCELIGEVGNFGHAGIVSLGPVGVGKSSNLNTIASYLTNRLEQESAAGSGASTLTTACRSHAITYGGRPVKWKWMDTPGDMFTDLVERWKRTELPEESPEYLSSSDYENNLHENVLKVLAGEQIGCVMTMVSAVELASQTTRSPGMDRLVVPPHSRLSCHLQVLKHMYRQLVRRGMRMICVITKVDLVDEDVAEETSAVQTSHLTYMLRQCVSQNTGLPMNQVHPVINLVHDFDPQANLPLGHLALFNVRSALRAAKHARLPPMPPDAIPQHNWNTLTLPSPILSDDGINGRSYPVDGTSERSPATTPGVSFPSLPQYSGMPDVKSVNVSQKTDIDHALLTESSQVTPPVASLGN